MARPEGAQSGVYQIGWTYWLWMDVNLCRTLPPLLISRSRSGAVALQATSRPHSPARRMSGTTHSSPPPATHNSRLSASHSRCAERHCLSVHGGPNHTYLYKSNQTVKISLRNYPNHHLKFDLIFQIHDLFTF